MRVAIVGSRSIVNFDWKKVLGKIPKNCKEIISGGAVGVDRLAKDIAKHLDLPFLEILPEYDIHGKLAPLKRNEQIAAYCDKVIAVWDFESSGTRHMLLTAKKLGKEIEIVPQSCVHLPSQAFEPF